MRKNKLHFEECMIQGLRENSMVRIYARNDRPSRPWKQQYLVSRSCTEATLKAKTQNLSKQNTSRENPAWAEEDKYKKGSYFYQHIFLKHPGSMSVSERRQKDSQSQRLEAQAH
ncbi:hypothetical protein V6N11_017557 [Hibiscus sabdariffa]|uniref:Uncharacterized protein n=1 Tax=Hibiscus sabdariffa TaxID=183260 RepID=A0ABR2TZ34_9ROSI